MPYYQNALYGQGVPTYAEQLSPLADVFKAFAPNPMRDLQIQGYVSKANLENLKGQQISQQLTGASQAADQFDAGNTQGVYSNLLRGGDPQSMVALPKFIQGGYAARAIDDPNSVNQDTLATLAVGAGGDYANTQPGFRADQARQLQQNENTVGASRYGSELQAGVGHEGNRLRHSASIYDTDQQASVGHEGNKMRFDASVYGDATRANVDLEDNRLRNEASRYTADQSRLAKEFDTKNDVRKTTPRVYGAGSGGSGGGGAAVKIDPGKLDAAVLQSLPGSFKDAKGKWQVDPSITPADLADVRTRVAIRVQENPADQYSAIQRAIADVYGDAPQMSAEVPAETSWYGSEKVPAVPSKVVPVPAGQRPPRGAAQQFAAPPGSAPAVPSMPTAQAGAAPIRVSSPEEARALPPGTVFITPDGRQKVR